MAKDPATLWYWNDWNGGTMTLTRHHKGCYMDLLSAQFNAGPLSLEQIKTVLGQDQAVWTVLSKKFKKEVNSDGVEVFFNERMEAEKEKRRAFALKQKMNGSKGGRKPKQNPGLLPKQSLLEDESEDENKNGSKDVGTGEGKIVLPIDGFLSNSLDKKLLLTEIQIGASVEFIRIKCGITMTDSEIIEQWEAFKIQQFEKKEWYNSFHDLLNHFRNSLKLEKINNGNKNGTARKNNSHRAVITGTAESAGTL